MNTIFLATNDIKTLMDYKRGIIPKDDEYKLKGLAAAGGKNPTPRQ